MIRTWLLPSNVALLALALAVPACGAEQDGGGGSPDAGWWGYPDAGGGTPECFSSNECPTGWTCSEFGTCMPPPSGGDGGTALPPEVEHELSAPVSSLRYVYVAMTEQDALAKIDGNTLAVTSLAVGEHPEVLAAAPGTDTVVVLDSVNGTATVVRPTVDRDEQTVLATLPHLNQLVVAPGGGYAVAWFDLNKAITEAGGLDFVDQIGSFQDVTIIDLTPNQERAVDLTVGFRPGEIEFDAAGTRAYVVTQDGVSVIDLEQATTDGPSIVPPIAVTDDPFTDPDMLEVDVVATGELAVIRETGHDRLRVLRLVGPDAGTWWDVPLPSFPTDVDLAPDGSRAYAVLRDSAALAVIELPGDAIDPTGVELVDLTGQVVGSLVLSDDGSRGLLFTNAVADERITVIELDDPTFPHSTYPLQKSVKLLGFAPDGDKALVVHAKGAGDPGLAMSFEEFVDRSHGYSVFDLDTGFAKLQLTPVEPGAFAFAPLAAKAYLILDGGDAEGAIAEVQSIELDTGVVRHVDLGSPPGAVGVLPNAGVTYVNQRHPLGRVSFIDIATGEVRTITGFDLNSRIID
jgi:DNA-binding beta-propeller fold protein YncE